MRQYNYKFFIAACTLFLTFLSSAFAHEYWIEPRQYEIAAGETILADLRNGQLYKGNKLYYLTGRFTKFEVYDSDGIHKVEGANGDQPALKYKTEKPGLYILSYQSVYDTLKFKKWEKFVKYTVTQGLDGIPERHLQRGLPQTLFAENYARTIKALVSVGGGEGQDRLTGLPYELVAQDNPFTMGKDKKSVQVRLFLEGKPAPNKQILIFNNNGQITETKTRTDGQGFADINIESGGKFMLSAVHMFEGDDDSNTKKPEWLSYWANLTFAMPGADEILMKAKQ